MQHPRATQYEDSLGKRELIARRLESSAVGPVNIESPIRVLVADDQDMMRELLSMSLQRMGYSVMAAPTGKEALELFQNNPFDLLLLDVVMPEMTGLEVCAAVRQFSDVPIIMLTALSRPDDVVKGLECGADNYITKPFSFKEVEAKIQAIVRRAFFPSELATYSILEEGDLWLDTETHVVKIAGTPVDLTPIEFSLLYRLMRHANQPVSKVELLEKVWPEDSSNNLNIVELAVRRLRTKIEIDVANPLRIITVRGFGYRLNTSEVRVASYPPILKGEFEQSEPIHRARRGEITEGPGMPGMVSGLVDDDLDNLVVRAHEMSIVTI